MFIFEEKTARLELQDLKKSKFKKVFNLNKESILTIPTDFT